MGQHALKRVILVLHDNYSNVARKYGHIGRCFYIGEHLREVLNDSERVLYKFHHLDCNTVKYIQGLSYHSVEFEFTQGLGPDKLSLLTAVARESALRTAAAQGKPREEGQVNTLDNKPEEKIFKAGGSVTNKIEPSSQVNHPSHYNMGYLEVIDVIEDWKLNFHKGNVIKYVGRAEHKGSELDDLKKARWYLNREIQRLEG